MGWFWRCRLISCGDGYRGQTADLLILSWCGFAVYLLHPTGISYEQLSFVIPLVLWTAYRKPRVGVAVLVWGGGLVLSYVFFTLSVLGVVPWADHYMPFMLYLGMAGVVCAARQRGRRVARWGASSGLKGYPTLWSALRLGCRMPRSHVFQIMVCLLRPGKFHRQPARGR